ncbi:hypothetical protein LGQ02_12295 [Bacillus shivajii]|uniref:putative amidoligase domain-containing protein n=1 Tax=Bacillus shivajii TaxID=1983719 RepID=UPI001CFA466E|nr:hypothetical protein [Bacillus shivajii]UCZ51644.1 hypothetical protein LGQ02_12295 [Bacillus shivajii]
MKIDPWNVHKIETSLPLDNALQVKVSGSEYDASRIFLKEPMKDQFKEITIKNLKSYYLGQELLDIVFQAAYYSDKRFFTVHVQRFGKEIQMISMKYAPTVHKREETNDKDYPLLGSDFEVMLTNNETKKFVSVPMMEDEGRQVGVDRALIRKGFTFSQPILELRTKPVKSGIELHKECFRVKKKLEQNIKNKKLSVISGGNPHSRFYLGGHFHISNQRPTYETVNQLDQLVSIPLAAISKNEDINRRSSYGRLGSLRKNNYAGFEYRTLSSWYKYIDGGKPFFEWIETVFLTKQLCDNPLSKQMSEAYYRGDLQELWKITESNIRHIQQTTSKAVKIKADRFMQWLYERKQNH